MTTEADYLELAADCKTRIATKNKEIKKLQKQVDCLMGCLSECRLAANNILMIYTLLDDITKGTRRGESNACMKRMNNCLQDMDIAFQELNQCDFQSEEMDILTRLTISQLQN